MGILRKARDYLDRCESFEQKLFMVVLPLSVIISAVATVSSIVEGFGVVASMAGVFCTLVPIVLLLVARKTSRYDVCYAAFCLLLMCGMMPITFLANGGVHSGMPLFCLGGLLLCAFCTNRRMRITVFSVSLVVNTAVMILAVLYPQIAFKVDEAFLPYDTSISFFVVAIGMLFVLSVVLAEYGKLTYTRVNLDRHMDSRLRDNLLSRQQELGNAPIEEERNVAVLFASLRGFSGILEKLPPTDVADYLETFFDIVDDCIHEHHGVLDKIMGDCVMAFWVDEDGSGEAVSRACAAALDIRKRAELRAPGVKEAFGCGMDFSCGVNYGQAMLCDVGSSDRRDYTIIGDVVNVASRLQNLAEEGTVLVSQSVVRELRGSMTVRKHPERVVLKGKGTSAIVFQLISDVPCAVPREDVIEEELAGFSFYVCGCRSSHAKLELEYSYYGGDTVCYVLRKGDYAIVIDCGTGFQRARVRLKGCKRVDVIITHAYYDHLIGLLDWSVFPEGAQLAFYGDFDAWSEKETISGLFRRPFWPVDLSTGNVISAPPGSSFELTQEVSVSFFASGKQENVLGTLIDVGGKRIWMMSDIEECPDTIDPVLEGCDILMFDDEVYSKGKGEVLSNWRLGVRIAEKTKPGRLIITGFKTDCTDKELRKAEEEARSIYPATSFARAGETFLL